MNFPFSGSCQCGGVVYTVSDNPLLTYACHCTECQKRTGSAFSMGMIIASGSFEVEGELSSWARTSDLGHENVRYSCKKCGNILYGIGSTLSGFIKLQPGTLNSTKGVSPDVHFWSASAQSWFSFPSDVPIFDKQPGDTAEVLAAIQQYQEKGEGS